MSKPDASFSLSQIITDTLLGSLKNVFTPKIGFFTVDS
jgi:hypothetical protein